MAGGRPSASVVVVGAVFGVEVADSAEERRLPKDSARRRSTTTVQVAWAVEDGAAVAAVDTNVRVNLVYHHTPNLQLVVAHD